MVHDAIFTLALQHSSWGLDAGQAGWVYEANLQCQALRDGSQFNPSTLQMLSPQADVLDLFPGDFVNCTSMAESWAGLQFLPPGNVTIKAVGQTSDGLGVANTPLVFVTIPSSPFLEVQIEASRCRQTTQAGELPRHARFAHACQVCILAFFLPCTCLTCQRLDQT